MSNEMMAFAADVRLLLAPTLLGRTDSGALVLLAVLFSISIVTDVRARRIPNRVTYSVACVALILSGLATVLKQPVLAVSLPLSDAVAGLTGCMAIMLLMYSTIGVGAGDVKLAAALGAVVGLPAGLSILLWSHVIAGVCAIGWLCLAFVWQLPLRRLRHSFSASVSLQPDRVWRDVMHYPLPMAVFFFLGTAVTFLEVSVP